MLITGYVTVPVVTTLETDLCLASLTSQLINLALLGTDMRFTPRLRAPAHQRVRFEPLLISEPLVFHEKLRLVNKDLLDFRGGDVFLALVVQALDFVDLRVYNELLKVRHGAVFTETMLAF